MLALRFRSRFDLYFGSAAEESGDVEVFVVVEVAGGFVEVATMGIGFGEEEFILADSGSCVFRRSPASQRVGRCGDPKKKTLF